MSWRQSRVSQATAPPVPHPQAPPLGQPVPGALQPMSSVDVICASVNHGLVAVIQQVTNTMASHFQTLQENETAARAREQDALQERVFERMGALESLVRTECSKISSAQAQHFKSVGAVLQGFRLAYRDAKVKEETILTDVSKQLAEMAHDLGETLERLKDPEADCAQPSFPRNSTAS